MLANQRHLRELEMVPETICQKLRFARNRLNEMKIMIADNRLPSDPDNRQQVAQEFFFHLLGSAEYLAQLINERCSLKIVPNSVVVYKVAIKLREKDPSDPILVPLNGLSADTKKDPFPSDPYSDGGLIYRIINYRNEVVHRNTNPFHFVMSAGPKVAYFWLDPRDKSLGKSVCPVDDDLSNMYSLVNNRCCDILTILG